MLAHMTRSFSPSEAAEQSGFRLDTLRYYERIGLLAGISREPPWPTGCACSPSTMHK